MSIESTMKKAEKLLRAGNRSGAAKLYREVLAQAPGHRPAQAALRALGGGAARPGAAPPAAQLAQIRAMMERGALPQALAEAEKLARLYPQAPALLNLLGAVQARAGQPEAALASFTRLTELDPAFPGGWLGRANAAGRLGRLDEVEAAVAQARALDAKAPQGPMILGTARLRAGQAEAAEAAFRDALALAPGLMHARLGLGNALSAQNDHRAALALYREAAAADPAAPEPAQSVANALLALGEPEAGAEALARALTRHPRHPLLRQLHARALRAAGRGAEALVEAETVTALAPRDPEAWGLRASCRRDLGDFDGAREDLDRALSLSPNHPMALALRWQDDPLPPEHPDRVRIEVLAEDPGLGATERALLSQVLFRAEDAEGDTEAAFAHLTRAKSLLAGAQPYDMAAEKAVFSALRVAFPAPLPALPAGLPEASPRPIFIVGMPRSGTTLAEQILAGHSAVSAAGELDALERALAPLGWGDGQTGAAPGAEDLVRLRESYLAALARRAEGRAVVTDKTPLNFRWLGFALAALPEARVLVMRRDPAATCWSNYTQIFTGRANGFGNDLAETAEMYRMHLDLIAHWQALFPGRIATVDYEALTEAPETEAPKLVAAAGLDWEPGCLALTERRGPVRTASAAQVRQKIYTGSSAAWRRYEAHLGPMLDGLAGLV